MSNPDTNSNGRKKLRVAFYIRVSSDDQTEMYGPDLQRESLEGLLSGRTYDLEFAGEQYVYKDLGKSGSLKIENRPGLKRLFDDLKYGRPFDIVAVYKIDRFARSLKVLLDIVDELKAKDIAFISTLETIDTSSHFGKAMLGILGVFAELEKDMNEQKLNDGKITSIGKGNRIKAPYGYHKHKKENLNYLAIDEDVAHIIKSIFDDFTSPTTKGSLSYIYHKLRDEKVLIPKAYNQKHKDKTITVKNPYLWQKATIERILKNEIYTGVYYYGKTKDKKLLPREKWLKGKGEHPAIISKEQFEKAQKILENKKRKQHTNKHTKEGHTYVFSGLLKCDACKEHRTDEKYFTWIGETSNNIAHYICKGKHKSNNRVCNTVPIKMEDLDTILLGEIKYLLDNPKGIKKFVTNKEMLQEERDNMNKIIENKQKKIAELEKGKENLYNLLKGGHISDNKYLQDIEELDNDITKYEEQRDKLLEKIKSGLFVGEYIRTLEITADILKNDINDILEDKEKAQKLMNFLIKEIIIYSKKDDGTYTFSGPKKEGRMVPYRVEIRINLPQIFINEFMVLNDDHFDNAVAKHLLEKAEEEEEKIDDENDKGGKPERGGNVSVETKNISKKSSDKAKNIKNTLKYIKENLLKGIILVKGQTSPFSNYGKNS